MNKSLRGINLGGWLIGERWMTPDLFKGLTANSERSIGRELGIEAKRRLTMHRNEFITESDFRWIAQEGFDFVRLPVGYWLFEEDEGYVTQERYVEDAFAWAKRYGLKVILDFHGLQGSQNGQDHSGQVGRVKFYSQRNRTRALETLRYLCETYGSRKELLGLEIINEPKVGLLWPLFSWRRLLAYYDEAIATALPLVGPESKIIVSDAFRPLEMAKALHERGYFPDRIVLDVHLYQVFGRTDKRLSLKGHIHKADTVWNKLLREVSEYYPVMVGEWSGALPMTVSHSETMRYIDTQRQTFETTVWGHAYWSYKAPGMGAWNYRDFVSSDKK